MHLIIVHGPPASGKLTTAKGLANKLGYGLLHNHLTVDIALEVYPKFGGDDFFEFVDSLRLMSIRKACESGIKGLITTKCYDTNDKKVIDTWIKEVQSVGGRVSPVYLNTSIDCLKLRVCETSRVGSNKLQTVDALEECLKKYHFAPIDHNELININTSSLCVTETVDAIFEKLF